jgi:hypothetical protein
MRSGGTHGKRTQRRDAPPLNPGTQDRTVNRTPPAHLDFRPAARTMSAGEMVHHVYQILLITAIGAEGEWAREAANPHPHATEDAEDPNQAVDYGERVREIAAPALAALSQEMLERHVNYCCGVRAMGPESLRSLTDEVLHHRGQLQIYRRLTGA